MILLPSQAYEVLVDCISQVTDGGGNQKDFSSVSDVREVSPFASSQTWTRMNRI